MKVLKKLAFTGITLTIAFSLLETAVRITNYDQQWMEALYAQGGPLTRIQIPDSYLLWRNAPRARYGFPPRRLNARGYRGPQAVVPKDPGVIRIAVLGDSCTFGIVQADEKSFRTPTPYPERLQTNLSRSLPRFKFEVLNYGVIGYTSYQGLRLLRREVLEDKPDFVVIRFGWNDHLMSSYARSFSNPTNTFSEAFESLLYRSRLTAMLLFPRTPKNVMKAATRSLGEGPVVWVRPEDYARNLVRMIELARKNGVVPILLDAPAAPIGPELLSVGRFPALAGYGSFERLVEVHTAYQKITERVAGEERVPFVETAVTYMAGKSGPLFSPYDIAHPDDAGHALIARRLYVEIAVQVTRMNASSE